MAANFGVKEFKRGFFDQKAIIKAMDKASRKAQSKMGAFIRRRAKSSLKYKDTSAVSGSPPFVHQGRRFTRKTKRKGIETQRPASPLRELLFFAYDVDKKTTIIGPAVWSSSKVKGVPGILEKGGSGSVLDQGVRKSASFAPHPFMMPALKAELPNFRELLRGSIS